MGQYDWYTDIGYTLYPHTEYVDVEIRTWFENNGWSYYMYMTAYTDLKIDNGGEDIRTVMSRTNVDTRGVSEVFLGKYTYRVWRQSYNQTITMWAGIMSDGGYADGTKWSSARYDTIGSIHTIQYNANGGSGAPSSQKKVYGWALNLSSTIPTRTGWNFLHWNTKSDDSGTSYAPGDNFPPDEDTTLYAQWTKIAFDITYDANKPSGATGNVQNMPSTGHKDYQTNYTIPNVTPVFNPANGYIFDKWNTMPNGSGVSYAKGAEYSIDADVTLYAQWKLVTYTVNYNANADGGSIAVPNEQTKTYGVPLTLDSGVPSRSFYTFKTWNTASNGSGTNYTQGASYTQNSSVTLYAQWERVYNSPSVSINGCYRVDSNGNPSDDGAFGKIILSYNVNRMGDPYYSSNVITSVAIKYRVSGSNAAWTTLTPSPTPTVNVESVSNAEFLLGSGSGIFDSEQQYDIQVEVQDNTSLYPENDISKHTTIVNNYISKAFFTMDFLAGGHGVAFGSPASRGDDSQYGIFDCAMEGHFLNGLFLGDARMGGTWYGTSDSLSSAQAKIATCDSDFKLVNGAIVSIVFQNDNSQNNITLNINGTGAKSVVVGGRDVNYAPSWAGASMVTFIYDGSYYHVLGITPQSGGGGGGTSAIPSAAPVGTITAFAASNDKVPNGYLLCDGSAISRTTYDELFAVIGTTYGSGNGSTTFNLPNLQGRFILGGSGTYGLASTGGAATVTLTTNQIPAHTHGSKSLTGWAKMWGDTGLIGRGGSADWGGIIKAGDYLYGNAPAEDTSGWKSSSLEVDASHEHTSVGGGAAHENMPPYIVVHYIIKYTNTADVLANGAVEYIPSTQTMSTNAWKGVTTSTLLYTGKTIAYKLQYAGTASNATLELTYPGGATAGAKNVYMNNMHVTNEYAAGSVILMVYDGSAWRVTDYGGAGTITEVQANGTSIATSGVANIPSATTGRYGVTQLSSATNSTSTTLAATASAVKAAYDLANGKANASHTHSTQQLYWPNELAGMNDIVLRPMVDTTRANRFAFLPADQIIIEKTTDGGTTWVDAGVSDATKAGLFAETRTGVNLPLLNGTTRSNLCGLRITVTAMKYNVPSGTAETNKYNYWTTSYVTAQERYAQIDCMYFWLGSNGDKINVKVECANASTPTTWINKYSSTTFGLTGWSGNSFVKFGAAAFGGGTTQTSQPWNWRITLMTMYANGSSAYSNTAQSIMEIRAYGAAWWGGPNNYMKNDHLYSWDYQLNATFPAQLTATKFNGALNGNASTATSATSATTSTKLACQDTRGTENPPNSLGDNAVTSFFQNTNRPSAIADWISGLHVRGWSGAYNTWELVGPASNSDQRDVPLFVRAGNSSTGWGAWRQLYDSTNKPSLSDIGAAASSHAHGNITSSGDITATAPTVASGDCIVINDDSESKITNGPAFDANDTTKYLRHDGTWGTPAGGSGSDTKVTQTLVADNNYYPLLLAPHGQSATTTTTANFSTKVGFNPSASMFGIGTDADYIYMRPNLTGGAAEILLGVYSESYGDEFEYKIDGEAFNQSSWLHISTDKAIADYIASQGGGGGRQATWYATCSTSASTAAKIITVTGWTPTAGDILTVLFTTANTAATPTLNVNSLGAKSIYIGGSTPNSTTNVLKWSGNTTITFMYDGTYYRYLGMEAAATITQGGGTWYGTSSTAATTAAKTSTITNFKLTPGAVVAILFSTANTYASGAITLNVNSTGAKTIYVNNAATSATNTLFWDVGDIVTFIYSGSYWYFVSNSNHYSERMELLWTNPNPTTSMSTQTLTLTDGYDAFIITSTATTDYGVLATEMIPAGVTVNIGAPYYSATGLYRAVTTTRTSVAFSVGSSADHVIPRYVWGVKNDTQAPTATVLYDDATGTTGAITLSSSAANFDHMKIYFKKSNGQGQCASIDVYQPNQKYANLTIFEPYSADSLTWFASKTVYINGTSMSVYDYANGKIDSSPSGGNQNEVAIYRIEAW